MSMCVPTRVTTIQAAERDVEDARRVLRAADGVEWVSDAADRFRAMLAEALGATAHLAHELEGAFRAVDAAHAAQGTALEIEVRGRRLAATVAPMPFVPHKYHRQGA